MTVTAETEIDPFTAEHAAALQLTAEMPIAARETMRWTWRGILLLFAAWTGFGIFGANEWYVFIRVTEGRSALWWNLLKLTLPGCWLYALMTVGLVWLVRAWPITRRTWLKRLPVYVVLGLASTFADVLLDYWLQPWVRPRPRSSFWALYISQFEFNFAIFAVVTAIRHAVGYYHQAKERQVRTAQLETQLTRAQLQVLKMQLQPHFLFNTLGAISELVHQDANRADRVIARLGDLLRSTIDNVHSHEVPLAQELDFVEAYLEIQRARFGDRLVVCTEIAPDVLTALVPSLVLQPLIENAIIHGTSARAGTGRIDLRARRAGSQLEVRIDDNGPGVRAQAAKLAPTREGIGLSNTRARLRQLYGNQQRFSLSNRSEGGASVLLVIPLRLSSDSPFAAVAS